MAAATLAQINSIMKSKYMKDKMANALKFKHTLIDIFPHNKSMEGDYYKVPLISGGNPGVSATASTAITNKSYTRTKDFQVTMARNLGVGSIDRLNIQLANGNAGSVAKLLDVEMDGLLQRLLNRLNAQLARGSSGSLGQIASSSGLSTTLTLSSRGDAKNFEIGDIIALSSADGTGSLRTGNPTITGVDRSLGTLTFGTAVSSTVSGAAVGDYIFPQGDHTLGVSGLSDWLPLSTPSATSFFNVDRSTNPTVLAGHRYDGRNESLKEALLSGVIEVSDVGGGTPDYIALSPTNWGNLAKSEQQQLLFPDNKEGSMGFQALVIMTEAGAVKVVSDRFLPNDRAYVLQSDTWELVSCGEVPQLFEDDGKLLRESTADAYEFRVGYYANLACKMPGYNGVIQLS